MDCEPTPWDEPAPTLEVGGTSNLQPPTWVLVHPGRESTKNLQRAKLWAPQRLRAKDEARRKDIDAKREP